MRWIWKKIFKELVLIMHLKKHVNMQKQMKKFAKA